MAIDRRTRGLIVVGVIVAAALVVGLIAAIGLEITAVPSASPTPTASASRAPSAEDLNRCGGKLPTARSDSPLVVTVDFAPAKASAASVNGTVTLTNSGTTQVTGTTPATPTVTLSKGGIVLWHSNGPTIAMVAVVDLAPGASMTYPATFSPLRCAAQDEKDGFRDDLPHVSPGSYRLSAAIDLSSDGESQLIDGPTSTILLG